MDGFFVGLMQSVQGTIHVAMQQVVDEFINGYRLAGPLENLHADPGLFGSFPVHASR